MTSLISFPFRLAGPNVATADDTSDDYRAEELSQLIRTHPGERELVPSYGLADPTFDLFDAAALTAQVALFGPPVRIVSVKSKFVSDGETDVTVTFDALSSGG